MIEPRYYVIFGLVLVLLQLLIFATNRTFFWLCADKLRHQTRRWISIAMFVLPNTLLLGTVLRLFMLHRLVALILLILLYISFVGLGVWLIRRLTYRRANFANIERALRLTAPLAFIGLLILSVYNAYMPRITYYQLTIDKPMKPLRIGMVSDLHLGRLFGNRHLDWLAEIFNQQKVDLILMPGDIMDDNTDAYLAEHMQPHLAKLRAPLGVYATLGNHDLFGHQQAISAEIRKAGITLLQDQSITLNNELVLIGRNDDLDKNRPSTASLLDAVENKQLPIILLDHRPSEIELHANLPIDLQVSGHAHKGQVFPANIITALTYRLDYGHEQINGRHFVVSSGYGFWGIPMRLGSQSEVVIIDLQGR